MRLFLFLFLITTFIVGCSSSTVYPTGRWMRQVADTSIGSDGVETLYIYDSTFTVSNNMTLNYIDSVFYCKMGFETVVDGAYFIDSVGDLIFYYKPESLTIDTICNAVKLESKKGELNDSIRNRMMNDLLSELKLYFYSSYESVKAPNGLKLRDQIIDNNSFTAKIDDSEEFVVWFKHL